MRELLDTPTQRRLNILEYLNEVSHWTSSNELAKINNASLRTINNDISYLKENWYPNLLIETSKKNGIRLRTPPSSHVQIVYSYVLKSSESFRLLESVFFNTTYSLEKWGEQLYISESSLYRITNAISQSLQKYGLTLEKRPCRIIGEKEEYVRFFYASYFREAYNITDWPFEANKRESVSFIENILSAFNIELDGNTILLISYILNVSLIRQSQGFFIESIDKSLFSQKMYDAVTENPVSLSHLAEQYGLQLSEEGIYDLLYMLFFYIVNWDSEEEKLILTKEINHFVKCIRDAFDLTLTNQLSNKIETAMKKLYLYHKVYPFRNYIIFDRYFYNGHAIKELFGSLNSVVEQGLKKMEKETGFPWASQYHYVVLCFVMIKWTDLPEILESKKQKANVLVMSSISNDHTYFLTEMINKNFEEKTVLTPYERPVIFLNEESPDYFAQYDVIVSTFQTTILPKEKLVVVDDIPSDLNWGMIRRAIDSVNKMSPNAINR